MASDRVFSERFDANRIHDGGIPDGNRGNAELVVRVGGGRNARDGGGDEESGLGLDAAHVEGRRENACEGNGETVGGNGGEAGGGREGIGSNALGVRGGGGRDVAEKVADVELAGGIEGEEPELIGLEGIGSEGVVEKGCGGGGFGERNGPFE